MQLKLSYIKKMVSVKIHTKIFVHIVYYKGTEVEIIHDVKGIIKTGDDLEC